MGIVYVGITPYLCTRKTKTNKMMKLKKIVLGATMIPLCVYADVGAARPKQVFYGNNRADFSFIPGNVAPGLLFRKPDHFENYDD